MLRVKRIDEISFYCKLKGKKRYFCGLIMGTSINCRERLEYKAAGAQKPECTQST